MTKALDSPDEPAILVLAGDADDEDDLAFEIRGNATGSSVDLSTTMSSTDTKFAIFQNGHTTIGYNSLGTGYTPVNAYGLNVNGTISSVSGYYVGSTNVINASRNCIFNQVNIDNELRLDARFDGGSGDNVLAFKDSAGNYSIRQNVNDGNGNYSISLGYSGTGVGEYAVTGDGVGKILFTGHGVDGGVSLNAAPTGTAGNNISFGIGLLVDGSDNTIRVGATSNGTGMDPGTGTKVFDASANAFATSYSVGSTTRINSVGDMIGTSYYIGSTNIIDTSANLTNIGTINSGAITSTGNSQFDGNVQIGDTVSQNAYGLLQVNQEANNDESGIGIFSSGAARSMRLWVDETNSYINSGNGGAANLILNEAITVSSGGNLTGVGTIRTADGANTSVSYGFAGDINTGMYSPANHELGFATNGSQRLKLDSNGATILSTGSVGLTINADTDNITESHVPYLSFKMDGSQERLRLGVDSSNNPYISTASDIALPLNIRTGTSDTIAMTLDGSQNVSIPNGTLTTSSITSGAITASGTFSPSGVIRHVINNVGIPTTYGLHTMEATDAQIDLVSSSAGTWGSAINFVEGASTSANTNNWSIARKTGSGGNTLNFNFGTSNQHDNTTRVSFSSAGAISSGAITSTGAVYANEFDLPSSGMLDWANGDARIVEGLVNNYSLSFQTYDGSACNTALRLDGNNTAHFEGAVTIKRPLAENQTLLTLKQENTASDIGTQESFIDFTFIDSNANNYPQVKIGAQVGQNGDANSTIKEGSGAFIVHTSNAVDSSAGGQAGMAERFRVDYQGNATATGNITAYSDERLKDNIETLDGSKVYEMRGVSFTKEGREGSGVIAQEIEKIAPELVNNGEYKSVAYGNLVGYLIEAVKDLKQEIEELKRGKDQE